MPSPIIPTQYIMLTISTRGQMMPSSPIRKLVPYAEAAVAKGINIFHLNIGQPDIPTPRLMLDAVRHFDFKVLEYSHSAGNESYRRKLVGYYQRAGIDIDYKQIIVTTGASEAILFAFLACLNPNDEIITPEPFYANYYGFALAAGLKVVPITSVIENGFALPPIKCFEDKITPHTKAIMICNPNNPTGYLYTKEEMEAIKELAIKHSLYLFCDEAYREFCYNGDHFSAMHLTNMEQHVIMVDSISKKYSACGGRIGALVSKNAQVIDAVMKFAQARLSPPTFAQIAAEAALDLPRDYFTETKEEYRSRRDLLVKRLNQMKGVVCPDPGGAFYVMAKLPIEDSDRFCQWLLEDFSHEGSTVMLAPATGFYSTPTLGHNEVRIAYVLNKESLSKAMDCLEVALEGYPGRRF